MNVYGWELTPTDHCYLRDDMIDAMNEIISKNDNQDLLFAIRVIGGIDFNLIDQLVVYGYKKDYDATYPEINQIIWKKFSFADLNEYFWGPTADLGEDWGDQLLNFQCPCFYHGVLYDGTYVGTAKE